MIKPLLRDDAFLADVGATRNQCDQLNLWWMGQSGFLIQWNQNHLLIDPYLSDSLTVKYAQSTKPHVRMTEIVVAPARLDFIDVITSSHNHTDHLDAETILPLMTANPNVEMLVPMANIDFAADRLQISRSRLQGIRVGNAKSVGDVVFHAIPAAHEELETDEEGRHRFIGLIIQCGSWTLYHSGDTIWYDGLTDYLAQWSVDIAMLPINGRDPKRGVAGNLSGKEAVDLAREIGAGTIIPCHFDMFTFNTVSPVDFLRYAGAQGQSVTVLSCGQRFHANQLLR